jgi:hypothetical protein
MMVLITAIFGTAAFMQSGVLAMLVSDAYLEGRASVDAGMRKARRTSALVAASALRASPLAQWRRLSSVVAAAS